MEIGTGYGQVITVSIPVRHNGGDDAYSLKMGAGRVKRQKSYGFTRLDLTDLPGGSAPPNQSRLDLRTQPSVSDHQPLRPIDLIDRRQ